MTKEFYIKAEYCKYSYGKCCDYEVNRNFEPYNHILCSFDKCPLKNKKSDD